MRVIVERVESYKDASKFVERVFEVFNPKFRYIKPNFLKHDSPENGCITHPELVKAVVGVAREHGVEPVVIEGGFYKNSASKCFVDFGLKDLVECRNLNREEFVEVDIGGEVLERVKVAETALDAKKEGYISIPKMKVHHLTKVTLGIKNNMGFLKKPAVYMHPKIHRKLVDLLGFMQPSLTIVDGIIGGTNSEMRPKPVKHGVLVAGDNVVAVDLIAARLMGFNLNEVEHIRNAMERFGVREEDIEVLSNPGIERLVRSDYRLSLGSKFLGRLGI
ncbi:MULTISPECIES: DUF362 domain-containing protein [Archaeoglobus]|jgi:uncharacterized protein (DUF362 family)|uniref:DUF362 domain-containing protein n=2 Tax=Archaeoglobus fulgidus TaxID=2234 RepID=A0A075WDX0_ARCFL|nr:MULTISPECIES: DUF362 domain-containing protein [Archaeoglobus]AIG98186.1 hypothetical protein AFULGI_00014170 [Archaeoglobus fulgidus DSM 8774]KUJ93054.1 MAG: hypothetical protein XD40_1737 [Archaeoglobus fulgidus]KUK06195.1 MAG: hypothetical protein XD48_1577 [Archaeoglobus fulgidus]MDI3498087.1 hypothetical protein [Archaeoglobus sp.]